MIHEVPDKVWLRPTGEIDLLMGSNFTNFIPRDKYVVNNLRIKSSIFGDGYCIQQGSSPLIKKTSMENFYTTQREDEKHAPVVQGFEIHIMRVWRERH